MSKPIKLSIIKSEEWMRRLFSRAESIGKLGEVPVAAVVLDGNGRCIGHGSNSRSRNRNPLGHAEITALEQASWIRGDWRFNDCTLIVNLEPCPMCAGALIQARMGQIIFGAFDFKRGALGGTIDLSKHKSSHHRMVVVGGILKDQASSQIQNWFKQKRNQ